jgi:Protein of unknown function (DUF2628)
MIWMLFRARDNLDVDVFTVHEPAQPPLDRIERAASLVFVRDGFSWCAALFSPFWLAVKGQWAALVAYFAVAIGASAVLWYFNVLESWFPLLIIGLNIYLGFEASTLERMWLNFRGWKHVGTVAGRNLPECERRFFDTWLAAHPADGPLAPVESRPEPAWAGWPRMFSGRA